jgi:uroporphyrinogen-III synthase
MTPSLIVTRPREQAQAWADALAQQGVASVVLPLIEIAAAADQTPLVAAWRTLTHNTVVMFVSANAVLQFFAAAPAGQRWPAQVRAACTGPGSAAALRAAGVPAQQVVAPTSQFDSEGLWSLLQAEPWAGAQVLVVRGEEGRDWLADRWREAGAAVHFVHAYRRLLPQWGAAESALADAAVAAPGRFTWLFSSSEAVANLQRLRPQANWSGAQAIATHIRVAEAALRIGFAPPRVVAPQLSAVVQALRETPASLQSRPL